MTDRIIDKTYSSLTQLIQAHYSDFGFTEQPPSTAPTGQALVGGNIDKHGNKQLYIEKASAHPDTVTKMLKTVAEYADRMQHLLFKKAERCDSRESSSLLGFTFNTDGTPIEVHKSYEGFLASNFQGWALTKLSPDEVVLSAYGFDPVSIREQIREAEAFLENPIMPSDNDLPGFVSVMPASNDNPGFVSVKANEKTGIVLVSSKPDNHISASELPKPNNSDKRVNISEFDSYRTNKTAIKVNYSDIFWIKAKPNNMLSSNLGDVEKTDYVTIEAGMYRLSELKPDYEGGFKAHVAMIIDGSPILSVKDPSGETLLIDASTIIAKNRNTVFALGEEVEVLKATPQLPAVAGTSKKTEQLYINALPHKPSTLLTDGKISNAFKNIETWPGLKTQKIDVAPLPPGAITEGNVIGKTQHSIFIKGPHSFVSRVELPPREMKDIALGDYIKTNGQSVRQYPNKKLKLQKEARNTKYTR